MIRHFAAAVAAILLAAVSIPAMSDGMEGPSERVFPSTVGEVVFHHQMHAKDLSIKCVECHHQINAKQLNTPHPDYFKSSWINCAICHNESGKIKQSAYSCSACHHANPVNIADETLSTKVVIHKQCWRCHQVATGKDASTGCEKCHSGKKTF